MRPLRIIFRGNGISVIVLPVNSVTPYMQRYRLNAFRGQVGTYYALTLYVNTHVLCHIAMVV